MLIIRLGPSNFGLRICFEFRTSNFAFHRATQRFSELVAHTATCNPLIFRTDHCGFIRSIRRPANASHDGGCAPCFSHRTEPGATRTCWGEQRYPQICRTPCPASRRMRPPAFRTGQSPVPPEPVAVSKATHKFVGHPVEGLKSHSKKFSTHETRFLGSWTFRPFDSKLLPAVNSSPLDLTEVSN